MPSFGRRSVLAGLACLGAGCATPTAAPGDGATVAPDGQRIGYPHLRASANRIVSGQGNLPESDPVELEVDATPTWLAAVPRSQGSQWAVVDQTDTLSILTLDSGGATVARTREWPATGPPVLVATDDGVRVVAPPQRASDLTPPLVLEDGLASVDVDGRLRIRQRTLDTDLLPDARLARLDKNRVVTLGGATTRYSHGALGDEVEASELLIVRTDEPAIERRIEIPAPRVVEGVGPLVTDLGGERAIVVTESGPADGAALVAYRPDGSTLARGDPIGTGFRWRHQVAAAPFGPDGEREIAVVKTPHIGGTVEFYGRRGDSLDIVAEVSGASSHAFGSRNLDGGVAADADRDGRTELVVPDDNRGTLRGVERRGDSAVVEWSVPIGGSLSTNVVGVPHGDGLALGVGHTGGAVRFWLPD